MSRAYRNRKKNREIGDLTYPVGGGRVSCNAFLSQFKKLKKKNMEMRKLKPNYGEFVKMGNRLSSGESESQA